MIEITKTEKNKFYKDHKNELKSQPFDQVNTIIESSINPLMKKVLSLQSYASQNCCDCNYLSNHDFMLKV